MPSLYLGHYTPRPSGLRRSLSVSGLILNNTCFSVLKVLLESQFSFHMGAHCSCHSYLPGQQCVLCDGWCHYVAASEETDRQGQSQECVWLVQVCLVSGGYHGSDLDYGHCGDGSGGSCSTSLHLHHHGGLPGILHLPDLCLVFNSCPSGLC